MRIRALLLSLLLLAGLTSCGSDEPAASGGSADTTAPADDAPDLSEKEFEDLTAETEVVVDTRDNSFREAYITVQAGTPITWKNRGRTEHNVLPVEPGAFASIEAEDLEPGEEGTVTFAKAGDYAYYCSLHGTTTAGMVGAVRVLE